MASRVSRIPTLSTGDVRDHAGQRRKDDGSIVYSSGIILGIIILRSTVLIVLVVR